MSFPRAALAAVAISLLASPGRARAQEKLDEEGAALVDIFARLPVPSAKGKTFVRYDTGRTAVDEENKLRFEHDVGFVVSESKDEIELLTPSLESVKRKRDWKLETEPFDFEERAAKYVADGLQGSLAGLALRNGFAHYAESVLLAHWARERGREDLALKLVALAKSSWRDFVRHGGRERPLVRAVADAVAASVRWRAISDANERAPRAVLLARWKLVAALPENEWSAEAKAAVAFHEAALAEDARWVEPAPSELEKGGPRAKVAYWLRKLPDAHATGQEDSGCRVLNAFLSGYEEGEKNPADELAALGWDALPALIDHLDDARPTRCMGYWRSFERSSYYLLTVGEACEQIFAEIAGVSLRERAPAGRGATRDERARAAKNAAQAVWQELQKKGEKAFLVERVEAARTTAATCAETLVARFPDAALGAIRKGIAAASDVPLHAALVSAAARLPGDAALALLREELAETRAPFVRLAAARALKTRGSDEGLPVLIGVWEKLGPSSWPPEGLIELLASSGSPAAARVLAQDLPKRSAELKAEVVSAFGRAPRPATPSAAFVAAVEDLLVAALEDEDEGGQGPATWGGRSFHDARVCDLAGHVLSGLAPERFRFDISAGRRVRDRQRVEIGNAWRKARGQQALDVPPALSSPEPAKDEAVRAHLEALAAPDPKARSAAASELERLGLAALPHVERTLGALPLALPARAEVAGLATRLACIVSEIGLAKGSRPLDEAWKRRLDDLRGRPLTARRFTSLLVAAAKGLPEGAGGIRLVAEGSGDRAGVAILVTVLEAPPARVTLGSRVSVWVAEECLHTSGGTASYDEGSWAALEKTFERAFTAGPSTCFSVEAKLPRRR